MNAIPNAERRMDDCVVVASKTSIISTINMPKDRYIPKLSAKDNVPAVKVTNVKKATIRQFRRFSVFIVLY